MEIRNITVAGTGVLGSQTAFKGFMVSAYDIHDEAMGKANGKGVYTYPNPAFETPNFLKAVYQEEPQLHS